MALSRICFEDCLRTSSNILKTGETYQNKNDNILKSEAAHEIRCQYYRSLIYIKINLLKNQHSKIPIKMSKINMFIGRIDFLVSIIELHRIL